MDSIVLELPTGPVTFQHLVLDYTGTLSLDGDLLPGIEERLRRLAEELRIFILTADTFGTVFKQVENLPLNVQVIRDGKEKADVVAAMGPDGTIAIGNGRNDIPMMEIAGLSVAVVGPEGAAAGLLAVADIVTRDICDALDLVLNPVRLKATLRN